MDPIKYRKILKELGEIRANCDSRPGDRRSSDVNLTHGLVLMSLKNIPACKDCNRDLDKPRSCEFIWRKNQWIERCGNCLLIRDPSTGKMIKSRAAMRKVTGKDGPAGMWPDPPDHL